jgi:hypothetical protein
MTRQGGGADTVSRKTQGPQLAGLFARYPHEGHVEWT